MHNIKSILQSFIVCSSLLILPNVSQCQVKYVDVNTDEIFGRNNEGINLKRGGVSWYWDSWGYAVSTFANLWQQNINEKRRQAQLEQDKQKAKAKFEIIKSMYESRSSYPEKISDGWRIAVASDGYSFCQDVKVFIKEGEITRFVIDNCIPLEVNPMSKITNGKCTVSINDALGEETMMLELWFVYDLDEPKETEGPNDPGYVTFWTKNKAFDGTEIFLNGQRLSSFVRRFSEQPEPGESGTVSLVLKPGIYYVRSKQRGSDFDESIEVKSGKCAMVKL